MRYEENNYSYEKKALKIHVKLFILQGELHGLYEQKRKFLI